MQLPMNVGQGHPGKTLEFKGLCPDGHLGLQLDINVKTALSYRREEVKTGLQLFPAQIFETPGEKKKRATALFRSRKMDS